MNHFVSLKYLVALDDHRHFGRAALACHVTQPALSNAIRVLEESFGVAIVKRGRNFAGFTPEGERILSSARRILREQELLQQDLHSSEGAPAGHLMIGAVPTALPVAARFVAVLQSRYPGIRPTLRSMSSIEIESGLESLALDMGLGYHERLDSGRSQLRLVSQYIERYYLLQKARKPHESSLQYGPATRWSEAAQRPLCLLSPEMHNRSIIDRAFIEATGQTVAPAIETNSSLALALSVQAGSVCSVMPGALLGLLTGLRELEALPLVGPDVEVPIAFMVHEGNRPSRTLSAALSFAESPEWLKSLSGGA